MGHTRDRVKTAQVPSSAVSEFRRGLVYGKAESNFHFREPNRSLFDNIEVNLDDIADKVGLTPEQVRAIANAVQANLTSSDGNPAAALEAAAAQQGVSVETIQEILNRGGGLESELG